jgi:periplasmic divalent cation tolerance protein
MAFMNRELIVFVTAPGGEQAAKMAEAVVEERLAACVNIVGGVESIYWWEGKVTRDREVLMIIKSTSERYAELEQRIKELHSYTTPEVVALGIERGSEPYLEWLRDSTGKE